MPIVLSEEAIQSCGEDHVKLLRLIFDTGIEYSEFPNNPDECITLLREALQKRTGGLQTEQLSSVSIDDFKVALSCVSRLQRKY